MYFIDIFTNIRGSKERLKVFWDAKNLVFKPMTKNTSKKGINKFLNIKILGGSFSTSKFTDGTIK